MTNPTSPRKFPSRFRITTAPRHAAAPLHQGDDDRLPGQPAFTLSAYYADPARLEALMPAILEWARANNISVSLVPDGRPFIGMKVHVTLSYVVQEEVTAFLATYKSDIESTIEILR